MKEIKSNTNNINTSKVNKQKMISCQTTAKSTIISESPAAFISEQSEFLYKMNQAFRLEDMPNENEEDLLTQKSISLFFDEDSELNGISEFELI